MISGTSCDGIDVAVVDIEGDHDIHLHRFDTVPMNSAVRSTLFEFFEGRGQVRDAWRMHALLGEVFAAAALQVGGSPLDLVASHGQTVYHQPVAEPLAGSPVRCTTQLADGCVIAARTGCPVVSDFRVADLALGGQGAPLVPYADALLFRHATKYRVALNIGGIANITWLPPISSSEPVRAFDTGPGNALMDAAMVIKTGVRYDAEGALASTGQVIPALLAQLQAHPYLARTGARSTGREDFGEHMVRDILQDDTLALPDVLATFAAFTATTIADGVRELSAIDEVYVAGGGAHNDTLMRHLAERLGPIQPLANLGVPVDAREAIAFALMGDATMRGLPSNVPTATGASGPAILGKISLPFER